MERENEGCTNRMFGELLPGFWIGSLSSLRFLPDSIESSCIDLTVISVLDSEKLIALSESLLAARIETGKFHHMIWKLPDKPHAGGQFLSDGELPRILNLIDEAAVCPAESLCVQRRVCLVHCARGVSRSAAVCAAWYISRRGNTLSQAMELMRKARPQVQPNLGFLASLRALEQCGGDIEKAARRMKNRTLNEKPSCKAGEVDDKEEVI